MKYHCWFLLTSTLTPLTTTLSAVQHHSRSSEGRPQRDGLVVYVFVERAQSGTVTPSVSAVSDLHEQLRCVTVEPLSPVPEACRASAACYDRSVHAVTWRLPSIGAP